MSPINYIYKGLFLEFLLLSIGQRLLGKINKYYKVPYLH